MSLSAMHQPKCVVACQAVLYEVCVLAAEAIGMYVELHVL